MTAQTYLSRGINYLGVLGAKLRDLQGYRTLAHELIQNADDAVGTSRMVFDVRDDALVVDNDGVFSACDDVGLPDCPWLAKEVLGHRCDFHRFRNVASGDKRGEAGTTGAFGIGFTAVYQVTDRPELVSAGRHWILDECRSENERIAQCSGCQACEAPQLPGTRFILPWAFDPQSPLRKELKTEPISRDGILQLARELEQVLPIAMLFLKKVRRIELRRNSKVIRSFERLDEGRSLILTDGSRGNDRIWHVFTGSFDDAAEDLRTKHGERIEPKRSAKVRVAIPEKCDGERGLLCACLPTEHSEDLPFHVDADFYPTNNRKNVILDGDYQSEWNRAALQAAAGVLASVLDQLPRLLGAFQFWSMLQQLKHRADRAGFEDRTLAEFWEQAKARLSNCHGVLTSGGELALPREAVLLPSRDDAEAVPLLESLGFQVVHEDLRAFFTILRSDADVAVLSVDAICQALSRSGLRARTEPDDLPALLQSPGAMEVLWRELALFLGREQRLRHVKMQEEQHIASVAVAPGRDGAFWPCRELFTADELTVDLFEPLGVPFLARNDAFEGLSHLCPSFDLADAIRFLHRLPSEQIRVWREDGDGHLRALFGWFEGRREKLLSDGDLCDSLADLSIYPCSEGLFRMSRLSLPGGFADPLGLAMLVDLDELGGRRDFLRDLGMAELDFTRYAVDHVPEAFRGNNVPVEKRRAAVLLLAERLSSLKGNEETSLRALSSSPLVECLDGEFRRPGLCYLDSDAVRVCLGSEAPVALLPEEQKKKARVEELYAWLGVTDAPRLEAIVSRIRQLSASPPTQEAVAQARTILEHLAVRTVDSDLESDDLGDLCVMQWLPAEGRMDRWYRPAEVFAAYQRHLFESQGIFLGRLAVKDLGAGLFKALGVRTSPEPHLVVAHLLHCSKNESPVAEQVYQELNNRSSDAALQSLADAKCLYIDGQYRSPKHVFWSDHPFGAFRWRLGESLRSYSKFLDAVGVRESPSWEDAVDVLVELAHRFGESKTVIDEETRQVVMSCWRTIGQALDAGAADDDRVAHLATVRCVPASNGLLNFPQWMFFENRAGLARKFDGFLAHNVIPRPVGTGRALDLAGVRALGTAVSVELQECRAPEDDPNMGERLRRRRNQVGRILEAQGLGSNSADTLALLDSICCRKTTVIQVLYRLDAFNRELLSPPEVVPALYLRQENTLLFVPGQSGLPWAAIARELAVALLPEEDPGRLAAGLKEALSAESDEEASATLDELGFAELDTETIVPLGARTSVDALGTDTCNADATGLDQGSGPANEDDGPLSPAEAVGAILGPGALPPPPAVPTPPEYAPGGDAGTRATGQSKTPRTTRRARTVLRSYVQGPEDLATVGDTEHDSETADRSPVDKAGVQTAMEHEREAGRFPKEMPHNNPGYDIESRDQAGRVVRYIEVKSFSGNWGGLTFAVLSRPQFDKAQEERDLFWLYVVEVAETEPVLHRIHNPASQASHFMFDDGWRAVAEENAPRKEATDGKD